MSNRKNELKLALENAATNIQLNEDQSDCLPMIDEALKQINKEFSLEMDDYPMVIENLLKPLEVKPADYRATYMELVALETINGTLADAQPEPEAFGDCRITAAVAAVATATLAQINGGFSVVSTLSTALGAVGAYKLGEVIEERYGANLYTQAYSVLGGVAIGDLAGAAGVGIANRFKSDKDSQTENAE